MTNSNLRLKPSNKAIITTAQKQRTPYPSISLPPGVTVEMVFVKQSVGSPDFACYTFEEALEAGAIKVVFDSPQPGQGLEIVFCRNNVEVVTTTSTSTNPA